VLGARREDGADIDAEAISAYTRWRKLAPAEKLRLVDRHKESTGRALANLAERYASLQSPGTAPYLLEVYLSEITAAPSLAEARASLAAHTQARLEAETRHDSGECTAEEKQRLFEEVLRGKVRPPLRVAACHRRRPAARV